MEITIQIETCWDCNHKDCLGWKSDQGFGYQVVPLMKEEIEHLRRVETDEFERADRSRVKTIHHGNKFV